MGCSNDKLSDKEKENYIKKAEEVVQLLNEEKYSEVTVQLDSKMSAALTEEQLAELSPTRQSGKFKKFAKGSVEEKEGVKIVILVAEYEKGNRTYTISFDSEDKIAGFYIK